MSLLMRIEIRGMSPFEGVGDFFLISLFISWGLRIHFLGELYGNSVFWVGFLGIYGVCLFGLAMPG